MSDAHSLNFTTSPLITKEDGAKPTSIAKGMWQKLKDENEQRKEGNIKYVSHEKAAQISGYGKDGPATEETKKKAEEERGKGDKRFLGLLGLSA